MAGLREFVVEFGTEERCIEHLAGLRWPGGFACAGCGGRQAWRLKTRPRVYECATCHRQESATAGTVFHRTRTDLTKWFRPLTEDLPKPLVPIFHKPLIT